MVTVIECTKPPLVVKTTTLGIEENLAHLGLKR